jgi:signal transduction histidine kinase
MLVLASGLIIAQLLSAAINLAERDSVLLHASGIRSAQRISDIVKLLDSSSPADRARIARILNVPPLAVSLDRPPSREESPPASGPRAAMLSTLLRNALGDDRSIRVSVSGAAPDRRPGRGPGFGPGPMAGPMAGAGMHHFAPPGMSILTQVQLADGTWATFDSQIGEASASLPWRLLLTLSVLLAAVLLLSYVAVRWVTRPLHVLAAAADELGRDIHRPPLPEDGPVEVRRAAHAFNTMQSRLVRLIEDRTRILAAMSHDLKTPITRMRLRAELLDDEELRPKFEKDLVEMQAMVTETLDFMRGAGAREPAQPVDVMALLESLQAENEDMGRRVILAGRAAHPYVGVPSLLKRCLANLIDNAVVYGRQAEVAVSDTSEVLTIRIRDHGPGVPEDQLEAVFEPFARVEASRSRETGGTGLGLSIARDIARTHGGDVRLRNHEQGGLEATLTLPRRRDTGAAGDRT